MKKATIQVLCLAATFTAGAVAGVLYAPEKGERTRRKIARKCKWMLHSASDYVEDGKESLEDFRDNLKEQLEELNDRITHLSKCRG